MEDGRIAGGLLCDSKHLQCQQRRDERKLAKGKYSQSKAQYVASALAGQAALEAGVMDDGTLDEFEVGLTNFVSDIYDAAYVED